jgi:type IV secretory pathway TrbL component
MAKVTIEIDSRWAKIVRSPLYWIVAALQGVSVTFAPLFLYWSGKGMFPHESEWLIAPSCFAVILFVGFFYMLLGGAVIGELRKKQIPA